MASEKQYPIYTSFIENKIKRYEILSLWCSSEYSNSVSDKYQWIWDVREHDVYCILSLL